MTAEYIRNEYHWANLEPSHAQLMQVQALGEIAAQLAELNATLKAIADPAVGISATLCASNDTIPVMIRER